MPGFQGVSLLFDIDRKYYSEYNYIVIDYDSEYNYIKSHSSVRFPGAYGASTEMPGFQGVSFFCYMILI